MCDKIVVWKVKEVAEQFQKNINFFVIEYFSLSLNLDLEPREFLLVSVTPQTFSFFAARYFSLIFHLANEYFTQLKYSTEFHQLQFATNPNLKHDCDFVIITGFEHDLNEV